jgi:competence protein ComFC
MANPFKFGLNILADVFYPKYCFGCKRSGRYLCKFCLSQVPVSTQSFCIICNQPSYLGYTHTQCRNPYSPDRLLSAFPYQHPTIAEMIIAGKYYFVSETFVILGMMAAEQIKQQLTRADIAALQNFILCPLPLHPAKKRWRGFNQAELIAGAFENRYKIPVMDLLIRTKNTKVQKDLDAGARQKNMANAFVVPSKLLGELPDKVIVVDDVCTTGQTFREATKALKLAGVKEVWCMSIAKD